MKKYVVNFDDAIIFQYNNESKYYSKTYESFESAKNDLISYWEDAIGNAKTTLAKVKKMKEKDV